MNDLPTSVFAYMLVLLNGCFGYAKVDENPNDISIADADNLRKEIISSIRNPFPQADTFVIGLKWKKCGPLDIPLDFTTKLEKAINCKSLSKQLNLPTITMGAFYKIVEKASMRKFKEAYHPNLWDVCRVDKVYAEFYAKRVSPIKVSFHESYLYNDIEKQVLKDFTFDNNKWTYVASDTSTSTRSY